MKKLTNLSNETGMTRLNKVTNLCRIVADQVNTKKHFMSAINDLFSEFFTYSERNKNLFDSIVYSFVENSGLVKPERYVRRARRARRIIKTVI